MITDLALVVPTLTSVRTLFIFQVFGKASGPESTIFRTPFQSSSPATASSAQRLYMRLRTRRRVFAARAVLTLCAELSKS
jgi:hypothetical protein